MTPSSDSTAPIAPLRSAETHTTLASTSAEVAFGEPLELLVTVQGDAPVRGTATLRVDGRSEPVGTAPVQDGRATIFVKDLPIGPQSLVAAFAGNRPASRSEALEIRVRPAETRFYGTLQPFHVVAGSPGEFTAFVEACPPSAAAPTGEVTFWQDGVALGTAVLGALVGGGSSGSATLVPRGRGRVSVTVRYSGTSEFEAAPERVIALEIADAPPRTEPVIPPDLLG